MYEQGRGVPRDFIQAHMWHSLSVAYWEKRASVSRDTFANQMTPDQIAEAKKLTREWKPKAQMSNEHAKCETMSIEKTTVYNVVSQLARTGGAQRCSTHFQG
jgi:phage terminase Nu1 subunit (DNA packaging protein)